MPPANVDLYRAALTILLICIQNFMELASLYMRRRQAMHRMLWSHIRVRRGWVNSIKSRSYGRRARQRWFALAAVPVPRRYWVYPRNADWTDKFVLSIWGDEQWYENFRMSKDSFMEILEAIREKIEKSDTRFRTPIPVERRLAIALWYLANQDTYRQVTHQFGVGLATVGEIVTEVCLAIELTLYKKTVFVCKDVRAVMDGFSRLGFPHCVGAVDGSHIPILNPGGKYADYGNRHNGSSVLLQGVVDHTGRFINTELGWSGRGHDAFMFCESWFCRAMDTGVLIPGNPTLTINGVSIPPIVVSDAAYPMRRWLMKPFGTPIDARERKFDYALARARNVVECAFGRLKARWRCLSGRLSVSLENINALVTTCVILHNICEEKGHHIRYHSQMIPESLNDRAVPPKTVIDIEPGENYYPHNDRNLDEGKVVRDALAEFMMSSSRA